MRFTTANLKISGPINYETEVMTFCCRAMKHAICSAKYVYDGNGVMLWGEKDYLDRCPYCGATD